MKEREGAKWVICVLICVCCCAGVLCHHVDLIPQILTPSIGSPDTPERGECVCESVPRCAPGTPVTHLCVWSRLSFLQVSANIKVFQTETCSSSLCKLKKPVSLLVGEPGTSTTRRPTQDGATFGRRKVQIILWQLVMCLYFFLSAVYLHILTFILVFL